MISGALFLSLFLLLGVSTASESVINVNFAGILDGTGSTGDNSAATIAALRAQVESLTAERTQLTSQNQNLTKRLYLSGFTPSGSINGYAPIPPNSKAFPTNRTDGMVVEELVPGSGVYFVTDTAYSSAVIDIGDSLVVIDAPPTYSAQRLMNVIQSISPTKPVKYFIYTHCHNDHVGLAGIFSANATYISHPLSVELIARNGHLPVPTMVTDYNNTRWTLGNKTFEFYYFDDAHSIGNMLIWLPETKTMMYIDIVYPQWVPFYAIGMTQDAIRFVAIHDTFLQYPFQHFIPGHLGRTATRDDVILAKQYLTDMKSVITTGFGLFTFDTYFPRYNTANGYNWWALLHNWQGDMAFYCAEKIIDKYKNILAGVELYAWSHCWHYREHIDLYQPVTGGRKRVAEVMANIRRK